MCGWEFEDSREGDELGVVAEIRGERLKAGAFETLQRGIRVL